MSFSRMIMSKQNKDRLEEFFIKGTQNYNFEFNEGDWKKLEKKLNKVDNGGFVPFWRSNGFKIFLASLAVVIAAILFLPVNKFLDEDDQITEKASTDPRLTIEDSDRLESNDEDVQEGRVNNDKDNQRQSAISSGQVPESKSGDNKLDEENPTINNQFQHQPNNQNSFQGQISDHGNLTLEEEKSSSAGVPSFNKSNENLIYGTGQNQYEVYSIVPIGLQENEIILTGVEIRGLENAGAKEEAVLTEGELIEEEKDQSIYQPTFSVGITISPDFSTVGIQGYSKPGTRVGGLLTFSLSEKFALRTGAILTQNIYSASGDQYKPGSGGGYGSFPTPEAATGECRIVDIPISLRYNFSQAGRHKWYLMGGFTSYVMLDEKYDFTYVNNKPPNAIDSWESDGTSAHIFGLVNLSIGYEHFISQKWSFQVEPFINIPVTGIGWGNVDLYSVGSYFTIKRNFYKSKE